MRLLAPALVIFACLLAGCVGALEPIDNEGGGGGGGGGVDAGGVGNAMAEAYFTQNVQPLLGVTRPKQACNVCHEGNNLADGPDFLGASPAANYTSLVGNTRLVSGTPATSVFVTRGDHTGNAFCTGVGQPYAACTQDEITIINTWIEMEGGN